MRTAAIIGCGGVSTIHTEALATMTDTKIFAVCDTDPPRLAATQGTFGVPGFTDHLTLLQTLRRKVAHICTPQNQHGSLAIDFFEHGVDSIVEESLAHNVSEGARLTDVAERGTAKVAVCFRNRHNTTVQARHCSPRATLGSCRAPPRWCCGAAPPTTTGTGPGAAPGQAAEKTC